MVENGIQNREFVDLEGVVETNLEQSYEKNHILTKFKDIDWNNEENDIETQKVANMTLSNSKILQSQTTKSMFFQMFHTLTF